MSVDLAEIARIRLAHRPEQGSSELQEFTKSTNNCVRCGTAHPCDLAKVLAALDDEIAAHVFTAGVRPASRTRRRARAARAKRRGR